MVPTKKLVLFTFLLLGANYLLPFNTLINLYEYYEVEKDMGIDTSLYITFLNIAYQAAAITVNMSVVFLVRRPFIHRELTGLAIAASMTITLLLLLALLALFNVKGLYFLVPSIIMAGVISLAQSISDALNLFYAEVFSARTSILAYSAGINVSGTVHALVFALLQLLALSDFRIMAFSYLAVTAAIVLLGLSLACWVFRSRSLQPRIARARGENGVDEVVSAWKTLLLIQHYFLLVVINFTVTLFIYPELAIRIPSPLPHFPLFNAILVFFLFNASALGGNILAIMRPTANLRILCPLTLCRALLCSAFFIVYRLDVFYRQLIVYPALTTVIFASFIWLTAFTSGYMASCGYFGAASISNQSHAVRVVALRLINLAISMGLSFGSILAYFISRLL